jgi:hypothetical protein
MLPRSNVAELTRAGTAHGEQNVVFYDSFVTRIVLLILVTTSHRLDLPRTLTLYMVIHACLVVCGHLPSGRAVRAAERIDRADPKHPAGCSLGARLFVLVRRTPRI